MFSILVFVRTLEKLALESRLLRSPFSTHRHKICEKNELRRVSHYMPSLLVSVRSLDEMSAARVGGADLIDIKEPLNGSLGRASSSVIAEIAAAIGTNQPVSAAFGELVNSSDDPVPAGLRYAKWGLSQCAEVSDWPARLATRAAEIRKLNPGCDAVGVAYADWKRAQAPDPGDVCREASRIGCAVLLVDTFVKDGTHLLNWLSADALHVLRDACDAWGMELALAGGITAAMLPGLLDLKPDWIAVRGAACVDGRNGTICPRRVQELAELVHAESRLN
jgi:uncharacterized protein (UPF0264 family)